MEEIWKKIKDYNYEVSNYGRVRRIETNRVLKTFYDKDKYVMVSLCKKSKCKRFRLHRLVALAFIPNPNKLPQVNHIDENKDNNNVNNLEWCNNKYNSNYGNRNRLISKRLSNFIIIQKDLNGNIIKIWDDIYELTHNSKYDYQHIRDFIRKGLKPKKYIWERIDLK